MNILNPNIIFENNKIKSAYFSLAYAVFNKEEELLVEHLISGNKNDFLVLLSDYLKNESFNSDFGSSLRAFLVASADVDIIKEIINYQDFNTPLWDGYENSTHGPFVNWSLNAFAFANCSTKGLKKLLNSNLSIFDPFESIPLRVYANNQSQKLIPALYTGIVFGSNETFEICLNLIKNYQDNSNNHIRIDLINAWQNLDEIEEFDLKRLFGFSQKQLILKKINYRKDKIINLGVNTFIDNNKSSEDILTKLSKNPVVVAGSYESTNEIYKSIFTKLDLSSDRYLDFFNNSINNNAYIPLATIPDFLDSEDLIKALVKTFEKINHLHDTYNSFITNLYSNNNHYLLLTWDNLYKNVSKLTNALNIDDRFSLKTGNDLIYFLNNKHSHEELYKKVVLVVNTLDSEINSKESKKPKI